MVLLITLTFFITISSFTFLLMNVCLKERIEIQQRVRRYAVANEKVTGGVEGSIYERLFKPALEGISKYVGRVTPKNYIEQLEKKLKEAGNPINITAGNLILLQFGTFIVEIIGVFSIWIAFNPPVIKLLMVISILVGITYAFPKIYLKQMIQKRQKEIEKTLPDIIDILTVSIEAGLSFDGAMAKLVEKMSGVLVQEFGIVLKEMRVGVSKRDALKSLIERVPVDNLITFIGAVLQADQLGVSVGNVLRIQSTLMRQKRRQRASEQAMKAPIKMLFPMVLFILPTIFIILLGPAIIKVLEAFSN